VVVNLIAAGQASQVRSILRLLHQLSAGHIILSIPVSLVIAALRCRQRPSLEEPA